MRDAIESVDSRKKGSENGNGK